MGLDIRLGLDTVIGIMDIVHFAIKSSHGLTENNYSVSFRDVFDCKITELNISK